MGIEVNMTKEKKRSVVRVWYDRYYGQGSDSGVYSGDDTEKRWSKRSETK
jgi:hypothetical protein